ncbi:MAG: tetratricopeptide repeat protein [Capnocytophaga sp.]|nr:tetratricopeptide repeat protein [Capnocytophaga sp.]
MKKIIFILSCISLPSWAQEQNLTKEEQKKLQKAQQESSAFAYEGFEANKNKKPIQSEMDYRKSISKNKNNTAAQYNMGDLLFQQKNYKEASGFYQEASISKGATKEEKHKAYHNLGNIAMEEKQYDKAVLAYKEALRNNPTDEETRYNLAVAKEMLKKNPPQNQDNNNNQDKNNDNKDQDNQQNQNNNQDNQQNNNNQDQNKDQSNENKDNKDQNNQQNQNNNQDNQQNNDNSNGEDQKNAPENQNGDNPQGKLSPEQAKRILDAMHNEEKKTQEKVNAQRVKGKPVRTEKDW